MKKTAPLAECVIRENSLVAESCLTQAKDAFHLGAGRGKDLPGLPR
ncbi:MAG: hypothetical protein HFE78_02390 [Clostridiales bacterium]|nr:hypothetical protein [Clostridiales bacterium]